MGTTGNKYEEAALGGPSEVPEDKGEGVAVSDGQPSSTDGITRVPQGSDEKPSTDSTGDAGVKVSQENIADEGKSNSDVKDGKDPKDPPSPNTTDYGVDDTIKAETESVPVASSSHDSLTTEATKEDSMAKSQDPTKNETETSKMMAEASSAVNAVLWEAGLNKQEGSKRTNIEDGAVVDLDLERCEEMTDLPCEIGQLADLRTLNLTGCKELSTLNPEIGKLVNLKELYLTSCHKLKLLPPEIGNLVNLTLLYLTNCFLLKSLPPEIRNLKNINQLYLTGCEELRELPPEIGELKEITELKLVSCKGLKLLPPQIGLLKKMTKLDLRKCENLRALPPEIGELSKLTTLNLSGCKKLRELPRTIGELKRLTELLLNDCEELQLLPAEISQLSQLTDLGLEGCTSLTTNIAMASRAADGTDASQSGLDIIGFAASHLEKVPEHARRGSSKKSFRLKAGGSTVKLDEDFFKDEMVKEPSPDEAITEVGEHDVLCGRGGETNHHPGNVKYRTMVKQHQLIYIEAKRLDKPRIALKIVNMVRKNGGRFLKKDGESGTWRDVGNQKAREKTSQTLREGAPELREPALPMASPPLAGMFSPYGAQMTAEMVAGMPVGPVMEQVFMNKRKAEMLMQQQSPRKKFKKLPIHGKEGEEAAMMTEMGAQLPADASTPGKEGSMQPMILPNVVIPPSTADGTPMTPSKLDVIYGKGKAIQDHEGNIHFRRIVDSYRQTYHAAFRRADKTQISKEIVWRIRSVGGRFLQLDNATGTYHDVGDECARDKVSHALRSRKDGSKPLSFGSSPMGKGTFTSDEERAQAMAYNMEIVKNLQEQHPQDIGKSLNQEAKVDASGSGHDESIFKRDENDTTDYSDWPMKDVKEPHENDVLYGRGGRSNHHPGNKRFRQAVRSREMEYLRRRNKDKQLVAMDVVREWRDQKPPGRFLKKDENTGLWNDVGNIKAREKTSQAFRENAPNHQPQAVYQPGAPALPIQMPMAAAGAIENPMYPTVLTPGQMMPEKKPEEKSQKEEESPAKEAKVLEQTQQAEV